MADTIDVSSLAQEVARDCPGLPIPSATREIRRAARDFCSRTWLWKYLVEEEYAVEGWPEIEIVDLPQGAEIEAVVSIIDEDDRYLTPQRNIKGLASKSGTPDVFELLADNTIYVHPTPDEDRNVDLLLALKPTQDTDTLPDWLERDWLDALIHKAKSVLFLQPGKLWTNPKGAEIALNFYRGDIGRARRQGQKSRSQGTVRMKMRRFV